MRAQIVLLLLGIAVTGSNSLVLSPILADVALGLGTTPVAVSRALAAYGGATALSAFLLAPRIDRVGAAPGADRRHGGPDARPPCSAPPPRTG